MVQPNARERELLARIDSLEAQVARVESSIASVVGGVGTAPAPSGKLQQDIDALKKRITRVEESVAAVTAPTTVGQTSSEE